MRFIETPLKGLYSIIEEPFVDKRGSFSRILCMKEITKVKPDFSIAQISHSITNDRGAIRGMHYQSAPMYEAKVVRCTRGALFDVTVDLREGSDTFLQWHGEVLTPVNNKMFLIPEGFAHGFQVLEEESEILYIMSEFYKQELQRGIRYDDPLISIEWQIKPTVISDRDLSFPFLEKSFPGLKL